jgi:tRNA acetyltransferase TAN1
MSNAKGGGKRKNKFSYHGHHNKRQQSTQMFTDGMKGLLVTCNFKEIEAVRETYNIVQQYLDKVADERESSKDAVNRGDEDLDKAIQKELSDLKAQKKVSYRQTDTRCNNVIFINILEESIDPSSIVSSLFDEAKKTGGEIKSRFVNRITPVSKTCKATPECAAKCVEELLGERDESESSFMVLVKIRNNNQLHQKDFIEDIAGKVKERRPKWRVDFSEPKVTICIDILIKSCCIGFLPDFIAWKKYNILEYASHLKKEPNGKDDDISKMTETLKTEECVKLETHNEDIKSETQEIAVI